MQHGNSVLAKLKEMNPNLKDLKNMDPHEIASMLAKYEASKIPKSRMHYRIAATRKFAGARRMAVVGDSKEIADALAKLRAENQEDVIDEGKEDEGKRSIIEFDSTSYQVYENEEKVTLHVTRTGNLNTTSEIIYETSNGSALAGEDYRHGTGRIKFDVGEEEKEIFVEIIDDNVYEPDEDFFVRLTATKDDDGVHLGLNSVARVTIINDDDPGCFEFAEAAYTVAESSKKCSIEIRRAAGIDGDITIHYWTEDGRGGDGTHAGVYLWYI